MGVIKRQGIKQSIVVYAALAVGAVNSIFVYPAALTTDELGVLNFVREAAFMICPFVFLGSMDLVVRFFPRFRNEKNGHNGFLFLLCSIVVVGTLLFLGVYLLFRTPIFSYFDTKSPLFREYIPFIPPITVLFAFTTILLYYASNFKRIAVPAIFNELVPKAGLFLLTGAYFLHVIAFNDIFWGQIGFQLLALLGMCWYVAYLGELHLRPNLRFLSKPLIKEMASFSGYGLLASLGSRVAERIDIVMLASLSTLSNTGIYSIAYFISNSIDIPRKAIARIAYPLVAEKWEQGNMAEIEEMYKKSALNQLIVGMAMFIAIWVSVDDLFRLMPNGENYISGKYVILMLGFARLIDMGTGINAEIIYLSKYYKFNFYLLLFLALSNIGLNFWLIPSFGVNGAALASLISLSVYNLVKFIVLKWKLQMQPFSPGSLWVLLIGWLAYAAGYLIPSSGIPLVDVALKSFVATGVFGGLVLYFRISPDLNQLITKGWPHFRRHSGK